MLLIIYRILLLVSWPKEILVKIDHLVSHVSKLALEHKCQLLIWSVKGKAKMCGMQRDISMLWFSMGVLVVKSKNVLASAIILLNLFLVCKVFLTLRLTIVFLVLYFLLKVKMPTSRSHMLRKCFEKFQLVLMTCKNSIFFCIKDPICWWERLNKFMKLKCIKIIFVCYKWWKYFGHIDTLHSIIL